MLDNVFIAGQISYTNGHLYTSVTCPLRHKLLIHSRLILPARGYCTQGMIMIRLVPSDAGKCAHSCYSCVASHRTPGIPICVSLGTEMVVGNSCVKERHWDTIRDSA